MRFKNIEVTKTGFKGEEAWNPDIVFPLSLSSYYKFSAQFALFLIQEAWKRGCDFEKEADGFGKGLGTMGGDWSGIRDSSPEATNTMLEKALNFLFPPCYR